MLPLETFKDIVKNAPLISIDFVITNQKDEVLLGKRVNKPACGFYFTLGGRIYKNETIEDAKKRIAKDEAGLEIDGKELEFLGVFEHFYDDSFVGDNISTHYINLAYRLKINEVINLPKSQHNEYKWFTLNELLESEKVNKYVKNIFLNY